MEEIGFLRERRNGRDDDDLHRRAARACAACSGSSMKCDERAWALLLPREPFLSGGDGRDMHPDMGDGSKRSHLLLFSTSETTLLSLPPPVHVVRHTRPRRSSASCYKPRHPIQTCLAARRLASLFLMWSCSCIPWWATGRQAVYCTTAVAVLAWPMRPVKILASSLSLSTSIYLYLWHTALSLVLITS